MDIRIVKVESHRQLKAFVTFPLRLYKDCENWVPALEGDEYDTFNPKKNGAYDFCEADSFLAYRGNEIVGRVAAIINHKADDAKGIVRFGWLDFIEDEAVLRALMDTVEAWGKQRGRTEMHGPWGFTDMDKEGLLVEGFDQPQTFEEQYNAEYYQHHVEQLGFVKEVDWTESRIYAPDPSEDEEDLDKLTEFIFRRYKLHFGPSRNAKDFLTRYADGIFELIDKSYDGLYGTVPFTEGMKKLMIDNFRLVISPKYTAVILDENERMVCFGFAIPSLASALVGTRGRYTPRVLWRLLRNIRRPKVIDLCLIGVDPEYLNRGVSAAFSSAILHMLRDTPVEYAETNLNLEDNYAIQNQWRRFKAVQCKRRRAYVKSLS